MAMLDAVPGTFHRGHEVKFLADGMLGRLARWLRILGYDTAYDPQADDHTLAGIARAEGRILLTRDTALARRRGVQAILIESQEVTEQVRQVLAACHLDPSDTFSRCAVCNVPLEPIDRAVAQSLVPPYVYQTQDGFQRCPRCKRIYWRGTHWANMQAQVDDWRNNQ
jgi:uncharacterized protein with PIN domain